MDDSKSMEWRWNKSFCEKEKVKSCSEKSQKPGGDLLKNYESWTTYDWNLIESKSVQWF